MAQSLHDLFDQLLREAVRTPEGRETIRRYDQAVTFEVLDGESFHADIVGGEADIQPGMADPKPLMGAHNIKAREAVLREWFEGRTRYSDAIHDHRIYPQAAHTTKRHIDNWLAKLVRLGQGKPSLRDEY